jgi:hypothetical protein
MEKTTVGLLGVLAGLAAMGSAQAANAPAPVPSQALQASSYAELLAPIPDAVALMRADDAARAQQPPAGEVQLADYNPYYPNYRHHHHHHHHHHQAYNHHHHHHHHHDSAYIGIPGVGVVIGSH